jgi:cysteine-rich repeat protein
MIENVYGCMKKEATNYNSSATKDDGSCKYICGNGIIEDGEKCDDGNKNNGDGCDEACMIETVC